LADIFSELKFINQPLARFHLQRAAQCDGPARVPMRCPRAVEYESRHDGLAFVSSPHAELGRGPEPDPNRRPEPPTSLRLDVIETDPSPRVSSTEAEPSLGECLQPQRAILDHFDADEISELTFLRKVRAKARPRRLPSLLIVRAIGSSRPARCAARSCRASTPRAEQQPRSRRDPEGCIRRTASSAGERAWAASRMRLCVLQRDHVPNRERSLEGQG
jgi:hypothetical protein